MDKSSDEATPEKQADYSGAMYPFTPLRFLAEAIQTKDPYTLGHCDRVARYCMRILDKMEEGKDASFRETLLQAAFLHDIGKVRVPDEVLKKAGLFNNEERMEMCLHPVHATVILSGWSLFETIGPLIRHHHERMDGTGYPDKLKGEAIPLGARIITVADVFDAITSKRVYHKKDDNHGDASALDALSKDARCGILDGRVVNAFIDSYTEGQIHTARAASYSQTIDPLVASAGGDERAPLELSRAIYNDALSGNKAVRLDDAMRCRVLLRLATVSNIEGDSRSALEHLKQMETFREEIRDRKSEEMQKALALRDLGKKREALEIATCLLKNTGREEHWLIAEADLLLADIHLDHGRLDEASKHVSDARRHVEDMREIVSKDAMESPLGVHLRWWSPSRIAVLEGKIGLFEARQARRRGYNDAIHIARQTAELLDTNDLHYMASHARCEQALFLSNQGALDEAVFLFERERKLAMHIGEELDCFRRTIWLAQAYSRRAATQDTDEKRGADRETALNLALSLEESAHKMGRKWQLAAVLATINWNTRAAGHTTIAVEDLEQTLRRSANIPEWSSPKLISTFILLAADPNADMDSFVNLAGHARDTRHAIQEVEILAEAKARFGELPRASTERLEELIDRMGGRCWLQGNPRYSGKPPFENKALRT